MYLYSNIPVDQSKAAEVIVPGPKHLQNSLSKRCSYSRWHCTGLQHHETESIHDTANIRHILSRNDAEKLALHLLFLGCIIAVPYYQAA